MIQTCARGAVMLFLSSWLWRRRDGASAGKLLSPLATTPWRNQDFTECVPLAASVDVHRMHLKACVGKFCTGVERARSL